MQPQHNQNYNYSNDYGHNDGSGFGRGVAATFISMIVVIATGFGVYYWQNQQGSNDEDELMARIEELEGQDSTSGSVMGVESYTKSGNNVAYKTHVGELELLLPDKYAVVVRADGKFGDSERSILRITEKMSNGVYRDVLDDYIEVEITPAKKSDKEELDEYKQTVGKNGYTLDRQFEAELGEYKGHLITGKSTFAQLRVYIIISGGYAYKIAQIMPLDAENEDNANLLAVINGMRISGAAKKPAPTGTSQSSGALQVQPQ